MSSELETKALLKGAHFLVEASKDMDIYSPEDFNEEQKMVEETAMQFVIQDHFPLADRMEHGEHDLNRDLLKTPMLTS